MSTINSILNLEKYKSEIISFLNDLVAIDASEIEKEIINRIKEEMLKVGFDKITIDPFGNILGFIGKGEKIIAIDAYVDDIKKTNDNLIFDNEEIILNDDATHKLGIVTAVYTAKAFQELGFDKQFCLVVVGSISKNKCPGLSWQYILEEDKIKPEFVLLTDPTNGNINLGHLGKIKYRVVVKGMDNSTKYLKQIIEEIKERKNRFHKDEFFGIVEINISEIFKKENTDCCWVIVEEQLAINESFQTVINEINNLPTVKLTNAKVAICDYEKASYTGLVYPSKTTYPSWFMNKDNKLVQAATKAYSNTYDSQPHFSKWNNITNGSTIAGKHNINTIGFSVENNHKKIKIRDICRVIDIYLNTILIYFS